jgi:HlyD family secretion protein
MTRYQSKGARWGKQLERCLAAAAVAVVAVVTLAGCKPPAEARGKKPDGGAIYAPKDEKPFLTPVVAERLTRRDVVATIATTGSVVPVQSRLIRAEEAGRLHFTQPWVEGDVVTSGTLIARIDSETLDTEIRTARKDVELRQESLAIATRSRDSAIRDYRTTQGLYMRGIVAQKDLDNAQLQMERAINSYRQELINLDRTLLSLKQRLDRLERLEIRAPFDGVLIARTTMDGTKPFTTTFGSETITDYDGRMISSEFAICGIADMSRVFIRADVTSNDVGAVRPGQPARALIYARTDIAVEGEVARISKSVSAETRAFQVDILVANPELALKPGMFGRVDIVTERRRNAISIPKRMILRRNNREVVYVVEKDPDAAFAVAREVPIEMGLQGRDEIEVTFGLKEGDALIVRGFEILQDRTPIQVIYSDEPTVPDSDKAEAKTAEIRPAS